MLKHLWTRAALLVLPMTLGACATGMPATAPGTQTGSVDPACISLAPIEANRGKPGGVKTEDVTAALDRDHPIERVRNVVGDTSQTLTQIDQSNAALESLCGGDRGR